MAAWFLRAGLILVIATSSLQSADEAAPAGPMLTVPRIVDDGFELSLVNLKGSVVGKIAHANYPLIEPTWSPDGKQLAYVAVDSLTAPKMYVADADGKNTHRLTKLSSPERHPCWSPTNEWIAFVSGEGGVQHIWLIHPDGTEAHRLAEGRYPTKCPAFSPDGKSIAFVEGNNTVMRMDSDGNNRRQLINRQAAYSGYPIWSADGQSLVFSGFDEGSSDIGCQLFIVSADNKGCEQLTRESRYCCMPAWSPDGQYIAYTRYTEVVGRNNNGSIRGPANIPPADLMLYDTLSGEHTEMLHACMPPEGPRAAWRPIGMEK
jgi:Tol biopolymer transport system component